MKKYLLKVFFWINQSFYNKPWYEYLGTYTGLGGDVDVNDGHFANAYI